MDHVVIRPATADDAEFLADMLVHAANTPSHPDRSRDDTLADPAIAHYVTGWPRATDIGVVAVEAGRGSIGAAWLRFFTSARPSHGFVAPDIPELAVGVVPDRRGHGVGRALVRAAADAAREGGLTHISLSVERANPAAALYSAEGYEVVERREHADTMVLALAPAPVSSDASTGIS
ncbi:GNAT family N-acetyltransferase [Spiractinospora alimapuensis]|uniref:GNAT family N-acetyltransferase n=1 Tax=Spiractinospora alimapuensis TaxID=2820884 RepID=UPI001F438571|nr:GNAT family N-acetyltransferase [Spiractinospora alimapuensis]QVQ50855.1 GNAT family N-acetyltransferase [Spiractinospora alimapuensis]